MRDKFRKLGMRFMAAVSALLIVFSISNVAYAAPKPVLVDTLYASTEELVQAIARKFLHVLMEKSIVHTGTVLLQEALSFLGYTNYTHERDHVIDYVNLEVYMDTKSNTSLPISGLPEDENGMTTFYVRAYVGMWSYSGDILESDYRTWTVNVWADYVETGAQRNDLTRYRVTHMKYATPKIGTDYSKDYEEGDEKTTVMERMLLRLRWQEAQLELLYDEFVYIGRDNKELMDRGYDRSGFVQDYVLDVKERVKAQMREEGHAPGYYVMSLFQYVLADGFLVPQHFRTPTGDGYTLEGYIREYDARYIPEEAIDRVYTKWKAADEYLADSNYLFEMRFEPDGGLVRYDRLLQVYWKPFEDLPVIDYGTYSFVTEKYNSDWKLWPLYVDTVSMAFVLEEY